NTSLTRQRCTGLSHGSADRKHQIASHPWRTSSPLRPGLGFRYTQVRKRHALTGTEVTRLKSSLRLLVGFLVGCLVAAAAVSVMADWAWALPVALAALGAIQSGHDPSNKQGRSSRAVPPCLPLVPKPRPKRRGSPRMLGIRASPPALPRPTRPTASGETAPNLSMAARKSWRSLRAN